MMQDTQKRTYRARRSLRGSITCPSCWHKFPVEHILFIGRHESMEGDAKLGPTHRTRFRPAAYDRNGDALDFGGAPCHEVSCPHCHLEVSRSLLAHKPLFLSIAGVMASGKTNFLVTAIRQLRGLDSRAFGFLVRDAHTAMNLALLGGEEALFSQSDPEAEIQVLEKTQRSGGALYQEVSIDGRVITFPRPFQFLMQQSEAVGTSSPRGRVLILYDNAGEHFMPGSDSTREAVTQHLGTCEEIFFMFDPTQDRQFLRAVGSDAAARPAWSNSPSGGLIQQDIVFNHLSEQVRILHGVGPTAFVKTPVQILVSKADLWHQAIGNPLDSEPLMEEGGRLTLDRARIEAVSGKVRDLLVQSAPNFVNAVESFSREVTWVPVSALGHQPRWEGGHQLLRPMDVRPKWVTVPFLLTASRLAPELSR